MTSQAKLSFRNDNDRLTLTSQLVEGGTLITIYRNGKVSKRYVSDLTLARHLGDPMYKAFHRLIVTRKEPHDIYEFVRQPVTKKVSLDSFNKCMRKLQSFPTSSYTELWRNIKTTHALIITLLTEYDWYKHQSASIDLTTRSLNFPQYLETSLTYISSNSETVVAELCNHLLDQFKYVKILFPDDSRINISLGIDPSIAPSPIISQDNWTETLQESGNWFLWLLLIVIGGTLLISLLWFIFTKTRR